MGIHVQKFKRVRIFITCVWIMHGEVRIDCWCQLLDKTKVFKLAERKSEMALKSRCVSGGRVSVTPGMKISYYQEISGATKSSNGALSEVTETLPPETHRDLSAISDSRSVNFKILVLSSN